MPSPSPRRCSEDSMIDDDTLTTFEFSEILPAVRDRSRRKIPMNPSSATSIDHHTATATALFGAGSLWSLVDAIHQGLPPWNLVPPILFGLAALVTALKAPWSRKG
jgi:hypothetical protein